MNGAAILFQRLSEKEMIFFVTSSFSCFRDGEFLSAGSLGLTEGRRQETGRESIYFMRFIKKIAVGVLQRKKEYFSQGAKTLDPRANSGTSLQKHL